MFEQQDAKFWKGDKFNFEDKGCAVRGGSSHKYAVTRRPVNNLVGYIKWQAFQYQMFPLNTYLSRFEMIELAKFCEERTKNQLADSVRRRSEYKLTRHIPGPVPKLLRERLQKSQNSAGGVPKESLDNSNAPVVN